MKKFTITLLFLLSVFILSAQESIPTSGGEASSNDGTVSYTVGQILYSTYSSSEGSVAEGVQQPYEISIVTGFDHADEFRLKFSAYPNPTKDKLTLHIEKYGDQDLEYQIYDQSGNIQGKENIISSNSIISMKNYSPGTYFLKIVNGHEERIVFKIVKH